MDQALFAARQGDLHELDEIIQNASDKESLVNFVEDETKNTPLHMACANGYLDCVKLLLSHNARHLSNASGNYPLHWAVQNKHLEVVKELLASVPDIDVLAQNSFGRGCVTEAFLAENAEILSAILEHDSATEERLAGSSKLEDDVKVSFVDSDQPQILQETTLEFDFRDPFITELPTLQVRELALKWDKDSFGSDPKEDVTGVTVWSASLILSKWIVDNADIFADKKVLELGAGCGVSGIACFMYTKAQSVILSDYFPSTVHNLGHNVNINKQALLACKEEWANKGRQCEECGTTQRFTSLNPDGRLSLCGGCKAVEYCSRDCQKKAWKMHKKQCNTLALKGDRLNEQSKQHIEAISLDWSTVNAGSDALKVQYDVLIGSDLIYHSEIVPILVAAVDGLLKRDSNSKFIHVASQARDSLVEFKEMMERKGFHCSTMIIPEQYKQNPLISCSGTNGNIAELFDLHFNEMSDLYCLYIYQRGIDDGQ